jgi:hypothetical protein
MRYDLFIDKIRILIKFIASKQVFMSRELQEKADIMIKELKEALIPLKEQIKILKSSSDSRKIEIYNGD